jgi:hypothetical protein
MGMGPNSVGDNCVCQPHYYNTTKGKLKCHATDFSAPEPTGALACEQCGNFECVSDCHGNDFEISPGWSVITQEQDVAILYCKVEDACPAASFMDSRSLNCTEGYTGILCGSCEAGYEAKGDGLCTPCKIFSTGAKIAMFVGFFVAILLLSQIGKWFRYIDVIVSIMESIEELEIKAIAKVVISAGQILGNLATVLGVTFPETFTQFLRSFSFAFSFDISATFSVGCIMDGHVSGFYLSSLVLNIGLAIVICILVYITYIVGSIKVRKKLEPDELEEVMKQFFTKVDRDGDGIEMHELRNLVMQLDSSVDPDEIDAVFMEADTDHGGSINFQEFYAALGVDRAEADREFDEDGDGPGISMSNPIMDVMESADVVDFDNDGDKSAEPVQKKGKKGDLDLAKIVTQSRLASVKAVAMGRVFLLVFLLYPALTSKIFEAFACRDLGYGAAVLAVDYTIDCESDYYVWTLQPLGGALLVLWPIGLPALLLFMMWHVRDRIMDDDHDTLRQFEFVIGDYKKEYYYWEVVELSRKLMLSGFLGFVGRGSVFQAVIGTVLAFVYFALNFHHRPFNSKSLNGIKICA